MNLKPVLQIFKVVLIVIIIGLSFANTQDLNSSSLILTGILGGFLGLLLSHKGLPSRTLSVLAGVIWDLGAVICDGLYRRHCPDFIRQCDLYLGHCTLSTLVFMVGSMPGIFIYAFAYNLRKKEILPPCSD